MADSDDEEVPAVDAAEAVEVEGGSAGTDEAKEAPQAKKPAVNPKQVVISRLPKVTLQELNEFFQDTGVPQTIVNRYGVVPEHGFFKGIVFATFKKPKAVKKALTLDGSVIKQCQIKIQIATEPPRQRKEAEGSRRIFVGNLPFDVDAERVKAMFKDCGDIVHVRFPPGKQGMCHVMFRGNSDLPCEKALHFHKNQVGGRPITVEIANKEHKNHVKRKKEFKGADADEEEGAGGKSQRGDRDNVGKGKDKGEKRKFGKAGGRDGGDRPPAKKKGERKGFGKGTIRPGADGPPAADVEFQGAAKKGYGGTGSKTTFDEDESY